VLQAEQEIHQQQHHHKETQEDLQVQEDQLDLELIVLQEGEVLEQQVQLDHQDHQLEEQVFQIVFQEVQYFMQEEEEGVLIVLLHQQEQEEPEVEEMVEQYLLLHQEQLILEVVEVEDQEQQHHNLQELEVQESLL
jgi:hypothetical protein